MIDFTQVLELDEAGLVKLTDLIKVRREMLNMVKKVNFSVGSAVKFNNKTRPKYLIGKKGKVTKINQKTVVVDLDERQGKWDNGIRVPLSLVDKA